MSASARRSVGSTLLVAVVVALVVAAAGWLLLLLIKATVVFVLYVLGAALVVAPLVTARRLLVGLPRGERIERIGSLAAAVLLGLVLIAIAHLVGRHGWLLIVVPAAVVGLTRLTAGLRARRTERRGA